MPKSLRDIARSVLREEAEQETHRRRDVEQWRWVGLLGRRRTLSVDGRQIDEITLPLELPIPLCALGDLGELSAVIGTVAGLWWDGDSLMGRGTIDGPRQFGDSLGVGIDVTAWPRGSIGPWPDGRDEWQIVKRQPGDRPLPWRPMRLGRGHLAGVVTGPAYTNAFGSDCRLVCTAPIIRVG